MNKIYNVKDYGAIGDCAADDTQAIRDAVNQANNDGGGEVFLPMGCYTVNNIPLSDQAVGGGSSATMLDAPLKNVWIRGESSIGANRTLIQRIPSAGGVQQRRIATMANAEDVKITDIAFDTFGIQRFGGFNVFGSKRIKIAYTHFFDSEPHAFSDTHDRYSYVFGRGTSVSEDILLLGNVVEDLQVEMNFMRRAQVLGNIFERGDFTAALGSFALQSDSVFEDIWIIGNKIV